MTQLRGLRGADPHLLPAPVIRRSIPWHCCGQCSCSIPSHTQLATKGDPILKPSNARQISSAGHCNLDCKISLHLDTLDDEGMNRKLEWDT